MHVFLRENYLHRVLHPHKIIHYWLLGCPNVSDDGCGMKRIVCLKVLLREVLVKHIDEQMWEDGYRCRDSRGKRN